GGTAIIGGAYGDNAIEIYSTILNTTRCDYVTLSTGQVFRNGSSIIGAAGAAGAYKRSGFGTAFGYTLVCAPNKVYKKDNGASVTPLGIATIGQPGFTFYPP